MFGLLPGDAQTAGELVAQLRVVEMTDGPAPGEQGPRVERRPPLILAGIDEIGDHHMGVQMGLRGTRRSVPVAGGHEPLTVDQPSAAVIATTTRNLLEQVERGRDRGIVGVAHLIGRFPVTESMQQRHRLGRAKRGVNTDHLRHRVAIGQPRAVVRIGMVQHSMERLAVDLTIESEPAGATAHPLPRRLFDAEVVLLDSPRNRVLQV